MSAININKDNFQNEVMNSSNPVLLDFWAPWCGPCRMVVPIVEEIAEERSDITVGKVNVDEQPELASQFGIMSIPTLVVIKDGKIVNQAMGARSKSSILEMLYRRKIYGILRYFQTGRYQSGCKRLSCFPGSSSSGCPYPSGIQGRPDSGKQKPSSADCRPGILCGKLHRYSTVRILSLRRPKPSGIRYPAEHGLYKCKQYRRHCRIFRKGGTVR